MFKFYVDFFQKNDKLCFEKVENEKKEKYNPNTIFNKTIQNEEIKINKEEKKEMIVHQNLFLKFFEKIKMFFKKILKK